MSTNAWDTASRLADKHANQGGIFIRLAANGDKVVGAFCGEPFAREVVWTGERYETYDPAVHTDKRPSLRVMLNFFVPAEAAWCTATAPSGATTCASRTPTASQLRRMAEKLCDL